MMKLNLRSYLNKTELNVSSSITIPSIDGIITILLNHENLAISLHQGIIKIDNEIKYFIYGGIANICDNVVDIISEFVKDITNVSSNDIDNEISKINILLNNSKDNIEISKYQKDLKYYSSLKEYL